jgi:hypothetical protein
LSVFRRTIGANYDGREQIYKMGYSGDGQDRAYKAPIKYVQCLGGKY